MIPTATTREARRASSTNKANQTVSLTLKLTKKQAEILNAVAADLRQPLETAVYGLLAHTLNTDHCSRGDFVGSVFEDLELWERDALALSKERDADRGGWQYAES